MNTYYLEIEANGHYLGTYDGATPEEAVVEMYRDAGYPARIEDGVIVMERAADAEIVPSMDELLIADVTKPATA